MAAVEGTPDLPVKSEDEQIQPAPEAGSFESNGSPFGLPAEALENTYVGRMDALLGSSSPITDLRKLARQLTEVQERYGATLKPVPRPDGSIIFFAPPEAVDDYNLRALEQSLGGTMIDGFWRELPEAGQ